MKNQGMYYPQLLFLEQTPTPCVNALRSCPYTPMHIDMSSQGEREGLPQNLMPYNQGVGVNKKGNYSLPFYNYSLQI